MSKPKRKSKPKPRKVWEPATAEPTEKTIPVVTAPVKPKPSLKEVVEAFPEARLTITQRWYGETFYPEYLEALSLLKEYAK